MSEAAFQQVPAGAFWDIQLFQWFITYKHRKSFMSSFINRSICKSSSKYVCWFFQLYDSMILYDVYQTTISYDMNWYDTVCFSSHETIKIVSDFMRRQGEISVTRPDGATVPIGPQQAKWDFQPCQFASWKKWATAWDNQKKKCFFQGICHVWECRFSLSRVVETLGHPNPDVHWSSQWWLIGPVFRVKTVLGICIFNDVVVGFRCFRYGFHVSSIFPWFSWTCSWFGFHRPAHRWSKSVHRSFPCLSIPGFHCFVHGVHRFGTFTNYNQFCCTCSWILELTSLHFAWFLNDNLGNALQKHGKWFFTLNPRTKTRGRKTS